MNVRLASVEDLPEVAEVHAAARASYLRDVQSVAELDARAEVLRGAYVPEKLADPTKTLLVAEANGEVVGMALIGPPHDDTADPAQVGELWQIHVRPDEQRRGVGSALHSECVRRWRAAGLREARLEVWQGNAVGRNFYARHGYRPDGCTRAAYGDTWYLRLVRDLASMPKQ